MGNYSIMARIWSSHHSCSFLKQWWNISLIYEENTRFIKNTYAENVPINTKLWCCEHSSSFKFFSSRQANYFSSRPTPPGKKNFFLPRTARPNFLLRAVPSPKIFFCPAPYRPPHFHPVSLPAGWQRYDLLTIRAVFWNNDEIFPSFMTKILDLLKTHMLKMCL